MSDVVSEQSPSNQGNPGALARAKLNDQLTQAIRKGDAAGARLALSGGASLLGAGGSLLAPLPLCARIGDAECLRVCLEALGDGDRLEEPRIKGALLEAAKCGNVACAEMLLDAGWDVDGKGEGHSILHWACVRGMAEVAALLVDRGASTAGLGLTVGLMMKKGSEPLARLLLEAGAPGSVPDSLGNTPLLIAAEKGREDLVVLALAHGASVGERSKRGESALHNGARAQSAGVVREVLARGANPRELSGSGLSALDLASGGGDDDEDFLEDDPSCDGAAGEPRMSEAWWMIKAKLEALDLGKATKKAAAGPKPPAAGRL